MVNHFLHVAKLLLSAFIAVVCCSYCFGGYSLETTSEYGDRMPEVPVFSFNPEEIEELSRSSLAALDSDLARILSIPPAERTFENTVVAFEHALDRLSDTVEIPQFLAIVSEDSEVRRAGERLKAKVGKYKVDLFSREDVFKILGAFAKSDVPLSAVDARLLEKRLSDFKKNGLMLGPERREDLNRTLKELVSLSVEFQKNIREAAEAIEVSDGELEGLPADYTARLKRSENGSYLVTTDYSDYLPFMEYARNPESRKRLYGVFNNRCAAENVELLERALELRRRVASILGYDSFADFTLADRMARRSEKVLAFLEEIRAGLQPKAEREFRSFLEIRGGAGELEGWDVPYLSNALKNKAHGVDHQQLREYFPLDNVLDGMFEIFGGVFGFRIERAELPVWHKAVNAFTVRDEAGGLISYLYLDLFPRPGKYKNPYCAVFRMGRESEHGRVAPALAIVADFSPPSTGFPSLLKLSEVEMLFHEFGHILHVALSRPKYTRLSPIYAAWDFLEIPSTLLQQWVYEPAVLRRISGHFKDPQKKLPDAVIEKLVSSRDAASAAYYLRMIALAKIDMRYHTSENHIDTTETYKEIMRDVAKVGIMPGTHPQASFGHLMPAYAAGYYGYLWAEVLASDIFSVFKASDPLAADIGRKYRESVLEPGAQYDEGLLLERFLGRPFSKKAFIERIGRG